MTALPKKLSKTTAKRKKSPAEEVESSAKKAKKNVPKNIDEPPSI